ncbi:hypothetical protein [Glaciimonas soli]|uniref:Uncharacterized protein n=1 Tax=Glaciimonas soli TaxID=2590999 RepID=A0A843YJX6_9BURK|nr:hypothetical protein [Glaciimonas soli]MQQ99279.1 hypothetical protein [Glaciimonas soli]
MMPMVRVGSLFQAWLALAFLVATVLIPTLANSAETNSVAGTMHDVTATLKVFNRDIVTFRSTLMGISSHDRALRAKARIEDQLDNPGPKKVTIQASPLGSLVQIDGAT